MYYCSLGFIMYFILIFQLIQSLFNSYVLSLIVISIHCCCWISFANNIISDLDWDVTINDNDDNYCDNKFCILLGKLISQWFMFNSVHVQLIDKIYLNCCGDN